MAQDNSTDKVYIRKGYHESGALGYEIPYKKGRKHGIEKWYYESGALQFETPYVDGKRHGIEKWYYESGALQYETPYKNDNEHGVEKNYDEYSTDIKCLALYNNGVNVASVRFDT